MKPSENTRVRNRKNNTCVTSVVGLFDVETMSSLTLVILCLSSSYYYYYIAMDVAMLRPSHQARAGGQRQSPGVSFSSQQSDKLWSLLTRLYAVGGYSHTFGALDPVQVIQMAPSLSSIYISGWQSSSTASVSCAKMSSIVCSVKKFGCLGLSHSILLSVFADCRVPTNLVRILPTTPPTRFPTR